MMRVREAAGRLHRFWLLALGAALVAPASPAAGQRIVSQAEQTIQIARGSATLLILDRVPTTIQLTDSTVADFELGQSTQEIVLRGIAVGTTSMFVWDASGGLPRLYNIDVVPDVNALQTQIETIFPTQDIQVTTTGNSVIVSGQVRDPTIVRRVIELAEGTGATVINNIQAPSAEQILLHVRFAEIRRSALKRLGADLFFNNIGSVDDVVGDGSRADVETLSEGLVNIALAGGDAAFDAFIRALRSSGEFKSLAEPNLIALEGQEATFLAGGEFPFPTVQGGGTTNAVTIQFREFGIRLRFTPEVTNSGTIKLQVNPEVSSLDFANGLLFQGFEIPALITRRASTQVELRPGQHLAIAGLLDNAMIESVDKIPFLGDLPILGTFFRGERNQEDRTELLVLVTPYLVEPSDVAPALPTGEPTQWEWSRRMRLYPDSVGRSMPQQRRGGG